MALRLRLNEAGRAWCALAALALLPALALAAFAFDHPRWDWQPALFAHEPWRAFSAGWVHLSALHLGANVLGTLLVAALGWVARLGPRAALAWLLAWPLTHIALLLQPQLRHYGGLSGLLHAGVAVAVVALWRQGTPSQRRIAAAIGAGLALKLLLEEPWGAPLRHPAGWDIAVAPLAHATGALAGLLCAAVLSPARQGAVLPPP